MMDKSVVELEKYRYLWRVDNEEWLKERKHQWSVMVKNFPKGGSAKELTLDKRFFLSGEWSRDLGYYLHHISRLLFTPYDSSDVVSKMFNSPIFGSEERRDILSRYIDIASSFGAGMPWLRQHIQWFVNGVMGEEYRCIEEEDGPRPTVISPSPSFWCEGYLVRSRSLLSNKFLYHGVMDCVDYFVSAVAHADKPKFRNVNLLSEVMSLAGAVSQASTSPSLAKEFAISLKSREDEIWHNWNLNSHLDIKE